MAELTLQHPFSYRTNLFEEISDRLTEGRLRRYLRGAPPGTDLQRAFRLYLWNIQLCEVFYTPLHFAEICIRNGIQIALEQHYQRADWYELTAFKTLLSHNIKTEMEWSIDKTRREHGLAMTPNHVVAAMSFGFWSHILTVTFEKSGIWPNGLRAAFPQRNRGLQRDRILYRVETLRDFRNRVAHHMAIYDQNLTLVKNTSFEMIGWCSPEIRKMLEELQEFKRIDACIAAKPLA
jgi:hypothetical protein